MSSDTYSVKKLSKFDVFSLNDVCSILYECGKDMAKKYDLHHWDNSYIKNIIVVFLCVLKNDIYIVFDNDGKTIATFQLNKTNDILCFQKLATRP